jgi:hypothetical protein
VASGYGSAPSRSLGWVKNIINLRERADHKDYTGSKPNFSVLVEAGWEGRTNNEDLKQ